MSTCTRIAVQHRRSRMWEFNIWLTVFADDDSSDANCFPLSILNFWFGGSGAGKTLSLQRVSLLFALHKTLYSRGGSGPAWLISMRRGLRPQAGIIPMSFDESKARCSLQTFESLILDFLKGTWVNENETSSCNAKVERKDMGFCLKLWWKKGIKKVERKWRNQNYKAGFEVGWVARNNIRWE